MNWAAIETTNLGHELAAYSYEKHFMIFILSGH